MGLELFHCRNPGVKKAELLTEQSIKTIFFFDLPRASHGLDQLLTKKKPEDI